MTKAEALQTWRQLTPDQPILPHFTPIPYAARGSRYGTCGVRVDGSPAFVRAVLSRLKDLLDGENNVTRLGLSWTRVTPCPNKDAPNAVDGAECCYIRLHMRGAQAASYMLDRHLHGATERYAKAQG